MRAPRFIFPLLALIFALLPLAGHAAPPPPPGLTLTARPALVDVGETVVLTLTAVQFPRVAYARISFVSPHHGFSGPMPWQASCSCFELGIAIARRIHPLETAHASVRLIYARHVATARTSFLIRGLAPDGRQFAPGGPETLTAWVTDNQPVQRELEHFCAWVRTTDGLGVPLRPASYVVHFKKRTARWAGVRTDAAGVACSMRGIGYAKAGYRVRVDIYAAGQHAVAFFTPRK